MCSRVNWHSREENATRNAPNNEKVSRYLIADQIDVMLLINGAISEAENLGLDGFQCSLLLNIMEHRTRAGKKDALEKDNEKTEHYERILESTFNK